MPLACWGTFPMGGRLDAISTDLAFNQILGVPAITEKYSKWQYKLLRKMQLVGSSAGRYAISIDLESSRARIDYDCNISMGTGIYITLKVCSEHRKCTLGICIT